MGGGVKIGDILRIHLHVFPASAKVGKTFLSELPFSPKQTNNQTESKQN